MRALEQIPDLLSFITLWDEDYGPKVIDAQPKSSLDVETLGNLVFTAFQYFYDDPDKPFHHTTFTLPLENLNRKLRILLNTRPNEKVRGGKQPFSVVVLLPDYFSDAAQQKYDPLLAEIGAKFIATGNSTLVQFDAAFKKIYQDIADIPPPPLPSITYPFTAAVEDFQAGVRMFQQGVFAQADSFLLKALGRFEADGNKKLAMEATYLLATTFAQQKQFRPARHYFTRLRSLASDLGHQKYLDTASFMQAFSSYKLGEFTKAAEQFASVNPASVNALQFYAINGSIFAKIGDHGKAIDGYRKAVEVSMGAEAGTLPVQRQRAQILYELGVVYFRSATGIVERKGTSAREEMRQFLIQAKECIDEALEVWGSLKDYPSILHGYQVAASIEILRGNSQDAISYLERARKVAEDEKVHVDPLPLFDKLIQLRSQLGKYAENIKAIQEFIATASNYTFLDLSKLAHYQTLLGDTFGLLGDHASSRSTYLKVLEILRQLKEPPTEMAAILRRLVGVSRALGDTARADVYQQELETVLTKAVPAPPIAPIQQASSLGGIRELWIFHSETGSLLFGVIKETRTDPDLFGGFLTAIQEFSINLSQQRLSGMVIGGDQFVFHYEEGRKFYILGRASARLPHDQVKDVLVRIYDRFWREYSSFLENFSGDTAPFESFANILATLDFSVSA